MERGLARFSASQERDEVLQYMYGPSTRSMFDPTNMNVEKHLPRNKRHGNVAVAEPPTPNDQENPTVSTATASDVADQAAQAEEEDPAVKFDFTMEEAPEDFEPNRKTPGRTRRPSFFDDKLKDPAVFGKGWQRVPVTSEEHKAAVLRELNRSKLYLGVGLELDTDHEDAVYFKSREIQKRERRAKSQQENGEVDYDSDEYESDEDNE